MIEIQRRSPVRFGPDPKKVEIRDNWTVALEYDDEGPGPWLVDLTHKVRWDLQDRSMDTLTVCDRAVPAAPGQSALAEEILINRMNRTQASIYHLGKEAPPLPGEPGFTDVTEATLFIALFGASAFAIAEKLTNLDFLDPAKRPPFLLQGPFCHLPCQIVVLATTKDGEGGFLLTCSRGYGDSMVAAILGAGAEFGLRPAGENRFTGWLAVLSGCV